MPRQGFEAEFGGHRPRVYTDDGELIEAGELIERTYVVSLPVLRCEAASSAADAPKKMTTRREYHRVWVTIDLRAIAGCLTATALENLDGQSVAVHGAVRVRLDRAPYCLPSHALPVDDGEV